MAAAPDSRQPTLVHATAIAVHGRAALLRGPSGSGKSDLALRCLTLGVSPLLPHPALLVADDQVEIRDDGSGLEAAAPTTLRGLIEVRGLGIITVPVIAGPVPVRLIVDLVHPADIPRLPDPQPETVIRTRSLPLLLVAPFEAAAAQKVLLALLRTEPAGVPPGPAGG